MKRGSWAAAAGTGRMVNREDLSVTLSAMPGDDG